MTESKLFEVWNHSRFSIHRQTYPMIHILWLDSIDGCLIGIPWNYSRWRVYNKQHFFSSSLSWFLDRCFAVILIMNLVHFQLNVYLIYVSEKKLTFDLTTYQNDHPYVRCFHHACNGRTGKLYAIIVEHTSIKQRAGSLVSAACPRPVDKMYLKLVQLVLVLGAIGKHLFFPVSFRFINLHFTILMM